MLFMCTFMKHEVFRLRNGFQKKIENTNKNDIET